MESSDDRRKRYYLRRRAGWLLGCCGCFTFVALALLIGLLAGLLSGGEKTSPATMTVTARYFNLTRIDMNPLCARTILVNPDCNATLDVSSIEQQVFQLSISIYSIISI